LNEGKREVRLDLAEFTLPENPSRSLELLQPLAAPPLEERSVILRAQALSATQRNQDAIEAVRELFEIQPASIYAAFWLGKLYEREKGGAWNARKYLMTFIRRADFLLASQKDENGIEIRQLKAVRLEADQILARVNKSLE